MGPVFGIFAIILVCGAIWSFIFWRQRKREESNWIWIKKEEMVGDQLQVWWEWEKKIKKPSRRNKKKSKSPEII